MKTLFLFIPNYVFSFDLIKTKYLEYLSTKYRIVVFLPTLENLENYCKNQNIEYKQYDIKNSRLFNIMKLFRIGMIKEFDELLSIKLHYKNSFNDFKRKCLRTIAKIYPFDIRASFFTKLETLLIKRDKYFKDLINTYRPSLILTCTPGFNNLEAEAIILSKLYKIKTVAMNFTWDNLTTNAKHIRRTDYIIAWNDIIKNEAINIHKYKSDNVFVSGITRFDYYFDENFKSETREEFLLRKNLDPQFKTLLLTTTSHGIYPYHKEIIETLLDLRDTKKSIPYVNIFVRIHPKDSIDRYGDFFDIDNLHVEIAGKELSSHYGSRQSIEMDLEDFMNLKDTLKFSDIAINHASTITLEAFIFNKPVINIGFPEGFTKMHYQYRHYEKIVNSGSVKLAESKEGLCKYINLYYNNSEIDKTNRQEILDFFIEFFDGLSYKRNVDLLENILAK